MNYTDSNNDDELLNFISKKQLDKEPTFPPQLVYFYSKAIKTALINTYREQKDIGMAFHCANIINSIFMLIYNFSLNIKLSIFICERSILLFNEYINISQSYNSDKINIMDIKQFIINKSIGPVKITQVCTLLNTYDPLLRIIKNFICAFFKSRIETQRPVEEINFSIENASRILSSTYVDLYDKGLADFLDAEFTKLLNLNDSTVDSSIHLIKIKSEILLYLIKKTPVTQSIDEAEKIINNSQIIAPLLLAFKDDENIRENAHFKNIIKNI